MVSRLIRYIWPAMLITSVLGNWGCAGNKSAATSAPTGKTASVASKEAIPAAPKSEKLEAARKAAEDAEMKAHQLREEKSKQNPASSH